MSSSSSDDGDWSMFQSVAITAEEVVAGAKKVRELSQARRAKKQRKIHSHAPDPAKLETTKGNEESFEELDPFQLKVATFLDQRLESQLKWVNTPNKKQRLNPEPLQQDPEEGDTHFKFFSKVQDGSACVVVKPGDPAETNTRPRIRPAYGRQYPAVGLDELESVAVDGSKIIASAATKLAAPKKRKLPAQGTVLDTKVFVPHEQRIAKLLGLQKEYVVV